MTSQHYEYESIELGPDLPDEYYDPLTWPDWLIDDETEDGYDYTVDEGVWP